MYIVTKQGHKSIRQATIVWKFKVQWKDYTKKLTPLNILKESNKVELAEFEVERDIAYQTYFKLWVPYTQRNCDNIIVGVNSCMIKKIHKNVIEIPTSTQNAKIIDDNNVSNYRKDDIDKQVLNVSIAFKISQKREYQP